MKRFGRTVLPEDKIRVVTNGGDAGTFVFLDGESPPVRLKGEDEREFWAWADEYYARGREAYGLWDKQKEEYVKDEKGIWMTWNEQRAIAHAALHSISGGIREKRVVGEVQ